MITWSHKRPYSLSTNLFNHFVIYFKNLVLPHTCISYMHPDSAEIRFYCSLIVFYLTFGRFNSFTEGKFISEEKDRKKIQQPFICKPSTKSKELLLVNYFSVVSSLLGKSV